MNFNLMAGCSLSTLHQIATLAIVICACALTFMFFMPPHAFKRHNIVFWTLTFVVFLLSPFSAFADTAPAVATQTLPVGAYIAQFVQWAADTFTWPVIVSVVSFFAMRIGGPIGQMLLGLMRDGRVEKSCQNAIAAGVGSVLNAVRGKTWTVQTSNAILSAAVDYAKKYEPVLALKAEAEIRALIFARLSKLDEVPAEVSSTKAAVNIVAGVAT